MFLFSGSHNARKKTLNMRVETFEQLLELVRKGLMVRTDSREVLPGEAFVAMPGVHVRGNAFVGDAVARGAEYVVTDLGGGWDADDRPTVIRHENPALALGELARAYFGTDRRTMKCVGITGTNGKTTTSYILEHLLAASGLKVGVLGTVTYRWPGFNLDASMTTPDCWMIHNLLSNMEKSDVDVVVMEVSSHALQQQRVAGLEFDVAVLSNLTQDHLDYHGDMEHYFQAKSRLFRDFLCEGGCGVINHDDPFGARLLADQPAAIAYGLGPYEEEDTPVLRGRIDSATRRGLSLGQEFGGKSWTIESPLIGTHNAYNLLAAQAAGLALGMSHKDMRRLSGFAGVPGRLQRVPNEHDLDIFVDYAHTPDALENVQRALRELDIDRLITVFGCGGDRDRTKRPLMARAVAAYADLAVLTSDNPRTEDPTAIITDALPGLSESGRSPQVIVEVDRQTAITQAVSLMQPGDCLLVAGKGHEDYQIVGTEKRHFSDVEAVQTAIRETRG